MRSETMGKSWSAVPPTSHDVMQLVPTSVKETVQQYDSPNRQNNNYM